MLQSLKIDNFKRFRELNLPVLKRVNLITGKNNTGKTALLEALLLLIEPSKFLSVLPTSFRLCSNIGDPTQNLWRWLFRDCDTAKPIVVTSVTDDYLGYSVALGMKSLPSGYQQLATQNQIVVGVLPAKIRKSESYATLSNLTGGVTALSDRPNDPQQDALAYDRLVLKATGEERLEALLRKIEPRLRNIRSIRPHGAPLLYVDVGLRERIPAVHLGQGFTRLLSIYAAIIESGNKVLLIDEFESGLHYSVLTDVWRGILQATEQEGVQVFATTHSYECIRAAHTAFAETIAYDFALHRLEESKDDITATSYDKETLETSLSSGFEIR